jgi:hypothetical protein
LPTPIADLLADRHRFAHLDQAAQIVFQRGRHAAHGNGLAGGLAARGQRDVQQARDFFGIAKNSS